MNKEGFTLVELLAILVVLGIIIVVAMPALVESNRVAKNNETDDFKELVETACDTYVAVTKSTGTVKISDLAREGYLKKNIKNPNNKTQTVESMNNTVSITNEGCKYSG